MTYAKFCATIRQGTNLSPYWKNCFVWKTKKFHCAKQFVELGQWHAKICADTVKMQSKSALYKCVHCISRSNSILSTKSLQETTFQHAVCFPFVPHSIIGKFTWVEAPIFFQIKRYLFSFFFSRSSFHRVHSGRTIFYHQLKWIRFLRWNHYRHCQTHPIAMRNVRQGPYSV